MKCQPQRKAQTTPPTTNNPPWNPVRMPSATGIPAGMNENIATKPDTPAKKICRGNVSDVQMKMKTISICAGMCHVPGIP